MQNLPQPPAPKNRFALMAGMLATAVRRGVNPITVAEQGFISQGPEFVYAISQITTEAGYQAFEQDPDAWKHLEPIKERFRIFLFAFIHANKKIVEREKIEPPAENLRVTMCPFCGFEEPLIGFVGNCPACGEDTREKVREWIRKKQIAEEPAP